MEPAENCMVEGSNPATTKLRIHCERNKTLGDVYQSYGLFFRGPFRSEICFAAPTGSLVLKHPSFVSRVSSGSMHFTTGRQMVGLVEFNHDEQPLRELSKSSRISARLFFDSFLPQFFFHCAQTQRRPTPTPIASRRVSEYRFAAFQSPSDGVVKNILKKGA